jgi:hypothetical protein
VIPLVHPEINPPPGPLCTPQEELEAGPTGQPPTLRLTPTAKLLASVLEADMSCRICVFWSWSICIDC